MIHIYDIGINFYTSNIIVEIRSFWYDYDKNDYNHWIINFTFFRFVGYCLKCLWWISSRSFSAISARDWSRLILVSPKYLSANVIFVFFLLFFRRCDCFFHDFMVSWDVSFWRYKTKSFYEDHMPFFSMYFYNDIKLEKGGKSNHNGGRKVEKRQIQYLLTNISVIPV